MAAKGLTRKACLFTAALATVVAGVVAYFVIGIPSDDDSSSDAGSGGGSDGGGIDDTTTIPAPTTLNPTISPTVTPSTSAPTTAAELKCNGLSSICDLSSSDVMYGALHNAMATDADGFSIINHELSLEDALVAGYRALYLDIHRCGGSGLQLVHGFCFVGTRDPVQTFASINQFLTDNPREVVLITLQVEGSVTLDEINEVFAQVPGFQERMYSHDPSASGWPTLGQLIDSDERILFFHYNGPRCTDVSVQCPRGFHDWFGYAAETDFSLANLGEVYDTSNSCTFTRGGGTNDFFGINLYLQTPSRDASDILNEEKFLLQHLDDCSSLYGGVDFNLIIIDFWSRGDVLDIVRMINEERGLSSGR